MPAFASPPSPPEASHPRAWISTWEQSSRPVVVRKRALKLRSGKDGKRWTNTRSKNWARSSVRPGRPGTRNLKLLARAMAYSCQGVGGTRLSVDGREYETTT